MTNEEVVNVLDDITWNGCGRYEKEIMFECRRKAINALQENTKLKAEIEQLKSELERSVKLPCKVGDVVYDTCFGFIEKCKIIKTVGITLESNMTTGDVSILDFGKTVFYSIEEAEQSLKGQV